MRVGTIGYATERGLGHLVRDFYRKRVITDVMVVRHPSIPTREDWYPGAPYANPNGGYRLDLMEAFCNGKDAMLFFETPFHYSIFEYCRRKGIRTYLVTMYECTHRVHIPPHRYLCPSLLDMDYFEHPDSKAANMYRTPWESKEGVDGARVTLVQLPTEYQFRQRHRARHFVHNGGYLGVRAKGGVMREGTMTLIQAMHYVQSPIRLTIRVQENVPAQYQAICAQDPRIEYLPQHIPYEDLYAEGDVAVGAQRWNGCSLPLQEAFAAGMLVMNTNRYPMNTWLPAEPLVPVWRYIPKSAIGRPYMEFDEADVSPQDLAATIDKWYDRDIQSYSTLGARWAAQHSWAALESKWREVLKS